MIKQLPSIILGLIFFLSGFVKGIDPMGLIYKLEEYFMQFNIAQFNAYIVFLAILLCAIEIGLGLFLLLGKCKRIISVITSLFLLKFTLITFVIYTNPYISINDCGCFGDAIKLTNGATFWKNLVLLAISLLNILIAFKYPKFKYSKKKDNFKLVIALSVIFSIFLPIFSYYLLPPFDFLNYNIGANVLDRGRLKLYDYKYNDVTGVLLNDSDLPQYLLISREQFVEQDIISIQSIIEKANKGDAKLLAISSKIDNFSILNQIQCYYVNDTVLKSLIRSPKGIVLINNGIIKGKWKLGEANIIVSKLRLWIWLLFVSVCLITILVLNINLSSHEKSRQES